MRQVESTHYQFPVAIESPKSRPGLSNEISSWMKENNLLFNRDWILIESGSYGRLKQPVSAYAFKAKDYALLFKMAFAG